MRCVYLLTGLLVLLAAAPAGASSPALGVKVAQCNTGASPADRSAVFQATMPRDPHAETMALRFRLYERVGDGDFKRVHIPGFGAPKRSSPNVAGLVFGKRVDQLAAPADYRVEVRFSWYDADGNVVRTARRVSRICHEPELRPDLRIRSISVGQARPDGLVPYTVVAANTGRTGALVPFTVAFNSGGVAALAQTVGSLDAGDDVSLIFLAPPCATGSELVAVADPDGAVDESRERNNTARLGCPAR